MLTVQRLGLSPSRSNHFDGRSKLDLVRALEQDQLLARRLDHWRIELRLALGLQRAYDCRFAMPN
jgi:hypothetical protein